MLHSPFLEDEYVYEQIFEIFIYHTAVVSPEQDVGDWGVENLLTII
jgi:hypothetical protein